MMPAIAFVIFSAVAVIVARRLGMRAINPISIAAVVWVPIIVVSAWPGLVSPSLSTFTWTCLAVGGVAFSAGVLGAYALLGGHARDCATAGLPERGVPDRLLLASHWLFVSLLLGFAVLEITESASVVGTLGGIGGLLNGGGADYRATQAAERASQLQSGFSDNSLGLAVLGYVLFLGHLSLFSGAVLAMRGRWLTAVVPLAVIAVLSVMTLQRTFFVMGILLFASYYLCGARSSRVPRLRIGRIGRYSIYGGVLAVAVGVILGPLIVRNTGTANATGLQSVLEYWLSGLAGFNGSIGVLHPSAIVGGSADSLGLGRFAFSGVASIIERVFAGGHLPPSGGSYVITAVAGHESATNVATSLSDFYLDWGPLGAIIALVLVGGLASIAQAHVFSEWSRWRPLAALLNAAIAWSFFANVLTIDFRYIVLMLVATTILVVVWYRGRDAPANLPPRLLE